MFRKKHKTVILAIILGVLLNACSKRQTVTEKYNTISDLAYSEKCKIEPIIYIEEKTGFVPYIVLTNDYNGKTLLLRKTFFQKIEELMIVQLTTKGVKLITT